MKVCLLNTYETRGGAARASYRLWEGLAAAGVDATLLVRDKSSPNPSVRVTDPPLAGKVRAYLDYLPLHRYRHRQRDNFSRSSIRTKIPAAVAKLRPDIVHLHWVTEGLLGIEDIPDLPAPLVWTLHDSWPFTGGCHLPDDCDRYRQACGTCPVLGSRRVDDLSRRGWQRKHRSYPAGRLTFVAPSQWMASRAKTSALLRGTPIEVIPNGVNVAHYAPGEKLAAREALGLPRGGNIILAGAKNILRDTNKGADLLFETVQRLPVDLRRTSTLVMFGDDAAAAAAIDMKTVNRGEVADEAGIVSLYRAADAFVMTSRQENLPNMILEAMACGLPCAAFGVGGIPEQIMHRQTGCLAPPFDTTALAGEIEWLIKSAAHGEHLSTNARCRAVTSYSLEVVARQHLDLYSRVLGRAVN